MARTKRKVNKTEAIKNYLTANPGVAPRDVAEALKEQGINVKPQYVSAIKSKSSLGGDVAAEVVAEGGAVATAPAPRRRRGRPRRSEQAVESVSIGYKSLLDAQAFVHSVGDIGEARKVLDAYAKLRQ